MAKRVTVELARDGLTNGYQVSINAYAGDGPSGDGYRIFGPKFNGSSVLLHSETLTARDAEEIRAYCDLVEPPSHPVLDLPMGDNDANAASVREYLTKLLAGVWEYGESFDGKRPFGNSSWEYELYQPLGRAGLIDVTFDEDGYIATFPDSEQRKANGLIAAAIRELGGVTN